MSKKSKKESSVKSSIIVLLLIAILLIASTYAWFTANKTVSISTLNVKVEAQNGLQISADGSNWKGVLSNTDLTTGYTGDTNQIPTMVEPVSTIGEVADGKMKMYYGKVGKDSAGDYALSATAEATETKGTSGRYIAFDVFLKVDADTNITLSANSNVVPKEGTTDRGLQNAARVAFLHEGNAAATAGATAFQALNQATSFGTAGATTYIWEPNSDVHTANAVTVAKDTYGITTSEEGATPIEYYGVKQTITSDSPIKLVNTNNGKDTTNFTKMTGVKTTQKVMTDQADFLTLKAGVSKIRIYMWVEGQDVDCENSASGSDISFNVEFVAQDNT